MDSSLIMSALFFVVIVVPSLTIHEYAHARASTRLGDITPRLQGRLTLNPLAHIDPLGTIVVPLLLGLMGAGVIGRAKPVPINPNAYRKPVLWEFLVAMAGPLSNIILGIIATIILVVVMKLWWTHQARESAPSLREFWLQSFALTNFMLAFFNLLPIPPLDWYRIITLVAPQTRERILENQQRITYILFAIMVSPLRHYLTNIIVALSSGLYRTIVALLLRI